MMRNWRDFADHRRDWLNLVIGVCFVGSPGVLGFADQGAAATNGLIVGAAIFAIALLALIQFMVWEAWFLGGLGLWSIAAPWALGFANQPSALWVHLVAGGLVAGFAAIELWEEHLIPPHDSGTRHTV